jgi:tetratricopeptide (TPR) repeat protein
MCIKKAFSLILLLLATSCGVYYNTFYNAKKYYAEATEEKEKNNNKVTPAIKEKFNKSISRCVYVLQEYPTSKYADDALLLMGQCYCEQEDYIKALTRFQEFERYYSDSPLYPTAKLYLARTYLNLKEYEKALTEYNTIINDNRFIEFREKAYLDLAEFYFNQGDYNKALTQLDNVIEMKASKESELNALFRYAQIQYIHGDHEEALSSFKRVLRKRPPKRMAFDARFYIGKILMELGDYKKAKTELEKLKKDEIDPKKIVEIDLQIGICNAYLGNYDKAFEIFEKIVSENKNKSIAIEAYYHWGDVYFSLLYDYENALEKFNQITSKDESNECVQKAIKKKDIANQFLTLKNIDPADDMQSWSGAQLKIAEYYLLDENKPDSAISIYDEIIKQKPLLPAQLDSLKNKLQTIPTAKLDIDTLSTLQEPIIAPADTSAQEPLSDTTAGLIDSLESPTIEDTTADTLKLKDQTQPIPQDTTLTETPIDSLLSIEDTLITPQDTLAVIADSLQQEINALENELNYYMSEVYPSTLLLKAWTLLKITQDTTSAYNVVELLENELPDSEYTFAARQMLTGKPITLTTQYEYEAKDYLNKAMKYYTQEIPIDSAFAYLDTILNSYQESKIYPNALYAKADLLLKEFSDTTSAKPYLKTLVTDFPNHELTQIVSTYFAGEHFIIPKEEEETTAPTDSTSTPTIPDTTYEKEPTHSIVDTAFSDSTIIDTTFADSSNIPGPSD